MHYNLTMKEEVQIMYFGKANPLTNSVYVFRKEKISKKYKLYVKSPYNLNFIIAIKKLGGYFHPKLKMWSIYHQKENELLDLIKKNYSIELQKF